MHYMDIQLIKYLTRKLNNYDNKFYSEQILTNFNINNNNYVNNLTKLKPEWYIHEKTTIYHLFALI